LADATDVVIAGGSAGSWGAAHNLDRIAERLAGARVVGILDSGWMPYGITPFGPGMFDVRPDSVSAYAYYDAQPDASCVAANPDRPAACMNQNFELPYISTPTFVFADQYDPQLLAVLGIFTSPRNRAELDYSQNYARQVRDTLAAASQAYFIADNARHTVLLARGFAGTTAGRGGPTLGATMHNWYVANGGPTIAVAPPPPPPGTTPAQEGGATR
jgi:hypothetical protein